MTTNSSVFTRLGFEVLACENGVYELKRSQGQETLFHGVGLFHATTPFGKTNSVKLFVDEIPAGVEPERIVKHWSRLDARRLEESGLTPIELPRNAEWFGIDVEALTFPRPDDASRERNAVLTASGEVVCFN